MSTKYTDKETAMKQATGMDKPQRKALTETVGSLMDQRRIEKDPVKLKEIEAKVNKLMGW